MGIKGRLTPESFVSKSMVLSRQFQAIQHQFGQKLNKLNENYVRHFCRYKSGQIITLPEEKEGYTHFKIEKITPQITPVTNEDGSQKNVEVTFLLGGLYQAEGKEDKKGTIQPRVQNAEENKTDETKTLPTDN